MDPLAIVSTSSCTLPPSSTEPPRSVVVTDTKRNNDGWGDIDTSDSGHCERDDIVAEPTNDVATSDSSADRDCGVLPRRPSNIMVPKLVPNQASSGSTKKLMGHDHKSSLSSAKKSDTAALPIQKVPLLIWKSQLSLFQGKEGQRSTANLTKPPRRTMSGNLVTTFRRVGSAATVAGNKDDRRHHHHHQYCSTHSKGKNMTRKTRNASWFAGSTGSGGLTSSNNSGINNIDSRKKCALLSMIKHLSEAEALARHDDDEDHLLDENVHGDDGPEHDDGQEHQRTTRSSHHRRGSSIICSSSTATHTTRQGPRSMTFEEDDSWQEFCEDLPLEPVSPSQPH